MQIPRYNLIFCFQILLSQLSIYLIFSSSPKLLFISRNQASDAKCYKITTPRNKVPIFIGRGWGFLPQQRHIAMLYKVLPGACYSRHFIYKYAKWLRCTIECAIPSCIYVCCLKYLYTPSVEYPHVFKRCYASLQYLEGTVWAIAGGERIG